MRKVNAGHRTRYLLSQKKRNDMYGRDEHDQMDASFPSVKWYMRDGQSKEKTSTLQRKMMWTGSRSSRVDTGGLTDYSARPLTISMLISLGSVACSST